MEIYTKKEERRGSWKSIKYFAESRQQRWEEKGVHDEIVQRKQTRQRSVAAGCKKKVKGELRAETDREKAKKQQE